MRLKSGSVLFYIFLVFVFFAAACGKADKKPGECSSVPENTGVPALQENPSLQTEKGYDLPVDVRQRKEAEEDCKRMMELIREIYIQADKGDASNTVLSDEAMLKMRDKMKDTNRSVIITQIYAGMENYENMDKFLKECAKGESGSAVVYEIHSGGGIGRLKFLFDGTNMYVFCVSMVWDEETEPKTAYSSCTDRKSVV